MRALFKDPFARVFFVLSIVMLFLAFVKILTGLNVSQGLYVVHFDVFRGVNALGGVERILAVPLLGFLFLTLNMGICAYLYARNAFLANIVAGATLVLAILIFIGTSVIISVN